MLTSFYFSLYLCIPKSLIIKIMKQKTTRFALTLLLSVLTAATAWAQFSGGNGTSATPYQIASASDLATLRDNVNNGNNYENTYFVQTAPITLTGTWTPIGDNSHRFKGHYNGGSHAISGLSVNGSYSDAGLFGYVHLGTVKNVVLVSPTVSSTLTDVTSVDVGTIAGKCSKATIENCHVINPTVSAPGNVYGEKHIGALIGNLVSSTTTSISTTHNTVTNCYFYGGNQSDAIGDEDDTSTVTRVSAAHLVTPADASVTIQTAMADDLGFTYGGKNYWRRYAELTLGYSGDVPTGYNPVYSDGSEDLNGSTLTVLFTNVTVSAAFRSDGLSHNITYMKADGIPDTHDAIALDETMTSLAADQWYYVGKDINYTGTVTIGNGEATIILGDGKTMNVGTSESRINGKGIADGSINHSSALTIYGQSLDDATAGHLNIHTTGTYKNGIDLDNNYTQHSGNVTISTTGSPAYGIFAAGGLTLNGGTLSVTVGNTAAIRCNHTTITGGKLDATTGDANKYYGISDDSGNITLGYTNASDYIHASSYDGTVNIADGQVFTDGNGNNFYGTITDASTIAGKMLTPSNTFSVAANQNPAAVGEYWATFHNPVAGYTVPSGTTAYIGTVNGSSLTLTEVEGGFIPAGNAVILKGTSASFDLSRADTGDAFDFTANELKGGSTVADGKVAYTLAAKNGVVGFYKFTGASLNPYKAHLEITPPPAQSAPSFFGFGGSGENTTAISAPESHASTELSGDYYTLDGRKLQGKPTQKGIYVRNGRKIIIK